MHHSFLIFHFLPASGKGFPGGTVVKNSPANAGDMGSVLGLERSLRKHRDQCNAVDIQERGNSVSGNCLYFMS